jgi:hypothetical protein
MKISIFVLLSNLIFTPNMGIVRNGYLPRINVVIVLVIGIY